MKKSVSRNTKYFTIGLNSLVLLIALVLPLFISERVSAVQSRKLLFPVSGTWIICQGYNGPISHSGNLRYSLDLSPDLNSANGPTGCSSVAGAPSASGKLVVAPAAGTVTRTTSPNDLINFQLDTGGCMQIGHFSSRVSNGHYNQGVYIGTLGTVTATNGGYPHLHLTASSSNCPNFSTPVGFADNGTLENANFQFYGAANFPASTTINFGRRSTITQIPIPSTDIDDNRTLTSGIALGGTISPATDQDTYYFNGTTGQVMSLSMSKSGSTLDSYLYLYGPNGVLLNQDDDAGGNNNSLISNYTLPQSGQYRVVAKSWNGSSSGTYTIKLTLSNSSTSCPTNYKAEYYNNRDLSGSPTYTRCENWPINWNWGNGGPGNGINNDNFSARWTGTAYFSGGNYKFTATSDDGVRVYLDNVAIIDKWFDQGPTTYEATRSVSAGNHNIEVKYYENGGGAVMQFSWAADGGGGSGTNLALNKSASATSQESSSYPPYKANDGSTSTRWSSQISSTLGPQVWKVDLGSSQNINQIIVRWEAAYARDYWIAYGVGTNCATATYYGWERFPTSQQVDTLSFATVTTRCVEIYMLQRAPGMGNYSIYEVEVYRR